MNLTERGAFTSTNYSHVYETVVIKNEGKRLCGFLRTKYINFIVPSKEHP
jgi:hypothetical protein